MGPNTGDSEPRARQMGATGNKSESTAADKFGEILQDLRASGADAIAATGLRARATGVCSAAAGGLAGARS